ncbi:PREDICTED: uncharacterized protein At4g37920, chloroplastic isoform X2 [Tarenaya hassleriana]|uniref:uncharacterized protein At4g37920, chloroplastic isoform X2 n=1 Tax=Tarenaya hassleriana TaxID=28532 RepID=UPI00053C3648|nr:PREDICTED: uncharacterized protein At4g37920, chloroplastic isoform X2 [Tarenaya hassleriana]
MEMASVSLQFSLSSSVSSFRTVEHRARPGASLFLAGNQARVSYDVSRIRQGFSPKLLNSNRGFAVYAVVDDKSVCPKDSPGFSGASPGYDNGETKDSEAEKSERQRMTKVCDKLIEVFMVDKPTPSDWRKLLAFSKEWDNIRPHFYNRCEERADNEEDPGMKHKLHRLGRKLKEVDEDVQRHNELLKVIKGTPPTEIDELVARRRKDFTKEFFVHLHTLAASFHDNPTEQNALTELGNTCLAAVQAYDASAETVEAISAAELKLQDIINSPSLDAACRKIDSLAEKNQLDSALVLMISKAWSAAKETHMMKDEVKDIMYHLYIRARENLQKQMPKEVRILKYLLMIEDPEERMSALKDAFTPGEELEGIDVDLLYTTPENLHMLIKTVLEAYHFSREGSLVREARDLMRPQLISKLEELKKLVEKHYM